MRHRTSIFVSSDWSIEHGKSLMVWEFDLKLGRQTWIRELVPMAWATDGVLLCFDVDSGEEFIVDVERMRHPVCNTGVNSNPKAANGHPSGEGGC